METLTAIEAEVATFQLTETSPSAIILAILLLLMPKPPDPTASRRSDASVIVTCQIKYHAIPTTTKINIAAE